MNIERLQKMVEMLRRIDEDRTLASMFDLGSWLETDSFSAELFITNAIPEQKMKFFREEYTGADCGTTACAMGFACLDPWFIKEGLMYLPYSGVVYTHNGKTYDGFEAAAMFFDIDESEAYYFFSKTRYGTYDKTAAWQVADRIEKFIEENSDVQGQD